MEPRKKFRPQLLFSLNLELFSSNKCIVPMFLSPSYFWHWNCSANLVSQSRCVFKPFMTFPSMFYLTLATALIESSITDYAWRTSWSFFGRLISCNRFLVFQGYSLWSKRWKWIRMSSNLPEDLVPWFYSPYPTWTITISASKSESSTKTTNAQMFTSNMHFVEATVRNISQEMK